MFAVVNPFAVETVVVRGFTDHQVKSIAQCLHSEYQTDVKIKRLGRGKSRRHELGSERISMAARRYLELRQAEQVEPVANSSDAGPWSKRRAQAEVLAELSLARR